MTILYKYKMSKTGQTNNVYWYGCTSIHLASDMTQTITKILTISINCRHETDTVCFTWAQEEATCTAFFFLKILSLIFYVLTHSECEEIRRGQGSPVQDSDTSVAFWTLVKTDHRHGMWEKPLRRKIKITCKRIANDDFVPCHSLTFFYDHLWQRIYTECMINPAQSSMRNINDFCHRIAKKRQVYTTPQAGLFVFPPK